MTTSIVPEHSLPFARLSQVLLATSSFAQISLKYQRQFTTSTRTPPYPYRSSVKVGKKRAVTMWGGAVNRQPGYRARNLQRRGFLLFCLLFRFVLLCRAKLQGQMAPSIITILQSTILKNIVTFLLHCICTIVTGNVVTWVVGPGSADWTDYPGDNITRYNSTNAM